MSSSKTAELRVSRFELGYSLLVALFVMLAATALWLASLLVFSRALVVPDEPRLEGWGLLGPDDSPAERGVPTGTPETDWVEPTAGELHAAEATVESSTSVAAESAAIERWSAPSAAELDALEDSVEQARRQTRVGRSGTSRTAGGGDDGLIVPRWERWQIRWAAESLEEYSRQLDYFQIELAVVGGDLQDRIEYASPFSAGRPQCRSGLAAEERRYYLIWGAGSPLREWDARLLSEAGIATSGRIPLWLAPVRFEATLSECERDFQPTIDLRQILRTEFELRLNGAGGWQVVVVGQTLR